jgi:uncharacterized protein (DUF427 family)
MAMSKQVLIPDDTHPITVTPTAEHVTVKVGDQVIAESDGALTLQESTYPAVQYVPLADIDPAVLRSTDHSTYCPYKGDASYYTVVTGDGELENAVWTYEQPYESVAPIAGHVAFYTDRVDVAVG